MLVSSSVTEPVFWNLCAAPAGTTTVCPPRATYSVPSTVNVASPSVDDEHLRVGVAVQRRPPPGLHVDEHERGVDAVLVAVERLRGRLGGEVDGRLEHQRLHAHTSPS